MLWFSLKSRSGLMLGADFIEQASVLFRIDPALLSLEKRLQKPQITEQLESGRDPATKGGWRIFSPLLPEHAYATGESCIREPGS